METERPPTGTVLWVPIAQISDKIPGMKVTCGACSKTLRVEDWLADNVARCPKCNEVIRIPPAGSPDGANAVVLSVAEATELLRHRAGAGQTAPVSPANGQPPKPGHPKTEPLPAFLRRASSSIHEEPEHRKTKPLPRPAGRPSPVLAGTGQTEAASVGGPGIRPRPQPQGSAAGAIGAVGEEAASPMRGLGLITPLVPIAFVLGLLVGVLCGWLIGRTGNSKSSLEELPPQSEVHRPAPYVVPSPEATPEPSDTPEPPDTPEPTVTPRPSVTPRETPSPSPPAAPQIARNDWLANQPDNPRARIAEPPNVVRRVAAVASEFPADALYAPAPAGQVYLTVRAKLQWAGGKPVTFTLSGPNSDCWLVGKDRQVFDPLGAPRRPSRLADTTAIADPDARVTLDESNPTAELVALFRVPANLTRCRLGLAGSQWADLTIKPDRLSANRDLAGNWEPIGDQLTAAAYDRQPILGALVRADKHQPLRLTRQGGDYTLTLESAGISGTMKAAQSPGLFDATLKMGNQSATATVRLFDNSQQMLIYFGDDAFQQYAYQRAEARLPGE